MRPFRRLSSLFLNLIPTSIRRRVPRRSLFVCILLGIGVLMLFELDSPLASTAANGMYNILQPPILETNSVDNNRDAMRRKSDDDGYSDDYDLLQTKQKCISPRLEIADPVMMKFLKKPDPIKCSGAGKDWVEVRNGTLVYSTEAIKEFGPFTCDIHPFQRASENSVKYEKWIRDVPDGSKLTRDYFKIECRTTAKVSPKKTFAQVRHAVSDNPDVISRMKMFRNKGLNSMDNPSVLILGFDSMSRMSWLRRCKRTRQFFVDKLGGIELKGYNTMGDGTPAALFPLLTGKHEVELPESRRNFPNAKPVDGFPWIWKEFKKAGYITAWGDLEMKIAPFNMRLLGFKNSPTDYYMRPYLTGVKREMKASSRLCQGSIPKHVDWLNRVRDLFYKYGDYPKFVFSFDNLISHGYDNGIMWADDDIYNLLVDLHSRNYFDHTLVILMGDHGSRYSEVRGTWAGKLEERLPYMGFLFPESFQKKYPLAMTNFKKNVERLTTPLDIHETLLDFLRSSIEVDVGRGNVNSRAISLFKEIPQKRSCKHANISNHWCACLEWEKVDTSDKIALLVSKMATKKINSWTFPHRNLCAKLQVQDVTSVLKLSSNDDMLAFEKSLDVHGRVPYFNKQQELNQEDVYQVTFVTSPGQGHFEATVSYRVTDNVMFVLQNEISRINAYGDAPRCILDKNVHIRQYCYCKDQP